MTKIIMFDEEYNMTVEINCTDDVELSKRSEEELLKLLIGCYLEQVKREWDEFVELNKK